MFYPELRNYLVQSTDKETVDLFDDAIKILDDFEVGEYMDAFDLAFGDNSDLGDTEVVDALKQTLVSLMSNLLAQHGVVLNDTALPTLRNQLCLGLYLLPHYEDKQSLLLILELDQTSQETFAELMELVTPLKTDVTLSYIESVDVSLIGKLKELIVAPEKQRIVPPEEVSKQIADYTKYREFNHNSPLRTDRWFENIEAIGMPYLIYLNIYLSEYEKYLGQDISEDGIKIVAKDLIAMACLSEESFDAAVATIRKYSDHIFSDINLATKLDIAINQIALEFSNAKTRTV